MNGRASEAPRVRGSAPDPSISLPPKPKRYGGGLCPWGFEPGQNPGKKPSFVPTLLISSLLFTIFSFIVALPDFLAVQALCWILIVSIIIYSTLKLGARQTIVSLALFILLEAVALYFPEAGLFLGIVSMQVVFITLPLQVEDLGMNLLFERYGLRLPPNLPGYGRLAIHSAALFAAAAILYVAIFTALSLAGLNDLENVGALLSKIPLYIIVLPGLATAFAEEFFFRGFLFRKFGALLSSALFAGMHFAYGSLAEIAAAFALGLLFCLYVEKTDDLAAPVLVHLAINAISLSVNYQLVHLFV